MTKQEWKNDIVGRGDDWCYVNTHICDHCNEEVDELFYLFGMGELCKDCMEDNLKEDLDKAPHGSTCSCCGENEEQIYEYLDGEDFYCFKCASKLYFSQDAEKVA